MTQQFTTPPGGIMTDDVGVITGDVEARIEGDLVRIRYAGADEEYTVSGSVGALTPDEVWERLTSDPGVDEFDNPRHVDLSQG